MSSLRFTRSQVEQAFGIETFRKGEEYFHDGQVLNGIKFGSTIRGEVLGTSRYLTRIEVEDGFRSECSCPAKRDCKHGVALALYYLNGQCEDGDKALQEIGKSGKFELLKALEKLIDDDPTLLPKVRNALRVGGGGAKSEGERKKGDSKLIVSVERRVRDMLRMLERGDQYAGNFVDSFTDLVRSNHEYMSKELVFFVLEYLVKSSEDYGYFYDDYSDSTYGEQVFEALCDALASKHLDERDFKTLLKLEKEDEYGMLDAFKARMAVPENAKALSKLPSARSGVKELLADNHDNALYVEFLVNSGAAEEAKKIIKDEKAALSEKKRFDLYLKMDEREAIEFAREKGYYHSLAEYYHDKGEHKDAVDVFRDVVHGQVGTPQKWLNDRWGSHVLFGKIFDSLKRDRPGDYENLARELFRLSYRLGEYPLCVEIGIFLDEPKLLYSVLESKKGSYWLDTESRIKLLDHLSNSDPERAIRELKTLTDRVIEEKKDHSYDQAVRCALIVKRLVKDDEWKSYLRSLAKAHYRKINLWRSFKSKGISQPER